MRPLVSLIVCTIGRRDTLRRLVASLARQTDDAFELIVVDQGSTDEIATLLEPVAVGQRVRHLRSGRGLSLGRNIGLARADGAIVGFPDDDCWYDDNVIERVQLFFANSENEVLTGRTVDRSGNESVSAHRAESGLIDRNNVFESGNSNTVFARTAVARDVGGFDETLGVGAATPFQSGEETDFLLRCLHKEHLLHFDRGFLVHHDQVDSSAPTLLARTRAYSQGYGRLLRLHKYGLGYLGVRVGRAAIRGAICLATGDTSGARQRYDWANGSLRGFLAPASRSEHLH